MSREVLLEQLDCREREKTSQHRSQAAENQALYEKLLYDPYPARAERAAHRNFALPPGGPNQKQVGHVDARNQPENPGRRQKRDQRGLQICVDERLAVSTSNDCRPAFASVRILIRFDDLCLKRFQVRLGCGQFHALS